MMPERVLRTYCKMMKGDSSDTSLRDLLEEVYRKGRLNPHEIVRVIFNAVGIRISPHSIRYWIKRLGLPRRGRNERPPVIQKAVESLGFKTKELYFISRTDKSFVFMADELNISLTSVQRAYNEFLSGK